MTTIGMLHYRSDPSNVYKAYAFAATAKAEGVDFFYFTPNKVNLEEKVIMAKVLEEGEWIEKKLPFPDVIYNAGSPITDKAYYIHEQLEEQIPFTSHSIGDKFGVYRRLKKGGEFSQYLLPTHFITNESIVFDFLDIYEKIIVKPVSGNKGASVLLIEKNKNVYIIMDQENQMNYTKKSLGKFLKELLDNDEYLLQPYISCKNKYGNAYDFRLHVQKNGRGEWINTATYPRVATPGKIVTNLNSGGYTLYTKDYLMQEFGDIYFNIKRYLDRFPIALAKHMDQIYGEYFDELGIDIGLDANYKIWIYEINWRPGVPPTFNLELDVAKNTIHYAIYLANKKANT